MTVTTPEDVLQRCLEEVQTGRRTPHECAALYPALPNLEDELVAAQNLRALAAEAPSQAAQTAHLARLRTYLRAQALNGHKPAARPVPRRQPAFRWALALTVIFALLLSSTGLVSAATGSIPGQLLYPVKRTAEAVTLGLTPAAGKPARHVSLAEERAEELAALAQAEYPDVALVSLTAQDATLETEAALASLDDAPAEAQAALLERLVAVNEHQQAVLAAVRARVPEQAYAGIDRAIQASQANQARAVERLLRGAGNAAEGQTRTPPGQTRVPPGQTRTPPGQTRTPPGQERTPPPQGTPPGQVMTPPGQQMTPPGQQSTPPGQQNTPPGQGEHVPPGQTRTPPGQENTPPGQQSTAESQGDNVPPGQTRTPPGQQNTPPGQQDGGSGSNSGGNSGGGNENGGSSEKNNGRGGGKP